MSTDTEFLIPLRDSGKDDICRICGAILNESCIQALHKRDWNPLELPSIPADRSTGNYDILAIADRITEDVADQQGCGIEAFFTDFSTHLVLFAGARAAGRMETKKVVGCAIDRFSKGIQRKEFLLDGVRVIAIGDYPHKKETARIYYAVDETS